MVSEMLKIAGMPATLHYSGRGYWYLNVGGAVFGSSWEKKRLPDGTPDERQWLADMRQARLDVIEEARNYFRGTVRPDRKVR